VIAKHDVLETITFGRRAGDAAADWAHGHTTVEVPESLQADADRELKSCSTVRTASARGRSRRAAMSASSSTTSATSSTANFLRHSLVRWVDGRPQLHWKPVKVTKWQPTERTY